MSISEKTYRFLMRAYSREYRSRYAEPMAQLFRDKQREARGFPQLLALWARTLADWVVSVPASYRAKRPSPFSSFGEQARRCVFFARFEAGSFSNIEITVDHLLLGVLRQEPALVPEAARGSIVRAIEANEPHERCRPVILSPHKRYWKVPAGQINFAREAIRVITAATSIAHAAGRQKVTPADLATAILGETDSLAARLLREHPPYRD